VLNLLGRETFLVKVEWEDDWPIFNDSNNITLTTAGRDIVKSASKPSPQIWKADLQRDTLELGWYQKGMFLHGFIHWHF
jgi:beta-xylosidase